MRGRNALGDTLGRRSRQARILVKTCFLSCYLRTPQEIAGRRSRQAMISFGTSISPYFHFCVRDRNILGDTLERRSRQVKILFETFFFMLHESATRNRRKA